MHTLLDAAHQPLLSDITHLHPIGGVVCAVFGMPN